MIKPVPPKAKEESGTIFNKTSRIGKAAIKFDAIVANILFSKNFSAYYGINAKYRF